MSVYDRPLVQWHLSRPKGAVPLAGGRGWFTRIERLERGRAPVVLPVSEADPATLDRLSAPRAAYAGRDLVTPQIMGIVNVTPDSFSDGGVHHQMDSAVQGAMRLVADGADILDIGGESTRPGAETVDHAEEIARTQPVIAALAGSVAVPISIDTRKADVAGAALQAGARIVNDVSGLTYDPAMQALCVAAGAPVCVMHAKGTPQTMQDNPQYEDVLLDVFDFLFQRVESLVADGLPRDLIAVDPGIGFAKTMEHNLALLNRISLFHAIGCPVLLGASRKRFIGTLSRVDAADQRVFGSVAVALAAVAQGVQILRVHDVAATRQALTLWQAVQNGAA